MAYISIIAKDDKLEIEKIQVVAKHPPACETLKHVGVEGGEAVGASSPSFNSHYEEEWGAREGECVEQSLLEEDLREVGEDPTELSSQVLLTYIIHVVLRSIMEIAFLVGQYYLFGFEVPHLFRCETYPCPNRTDCFVSRATEKTIFLNFMFSISLGCFILNIVELHYLGWVYIFHVLCSACSTCCEPERDPVERVDLYHNHNPLLLQLKLFLRGRVVLQTPPPMSQEKSSGILSTHTPAISLETDSTVECTSKRSPDEKERTKAKLVNMSKTGRGKKSWL